MTKAIATAPRERPVLMSRPMVKSILAGEKTMTRRVAKTFPSDSSCTGHLVRLPRDRSIETDWRAIPFCPYGRVGDRLWVRETWALVHCSEEGIDDWPPHRAIPRNPPGMGWQAWHRTGHPWADDCKEDRGFRWRPSIHMPRWASRLTLEITGVRVERLQEISLEDVIAEGISPVEDGAHANQYWREETGAKFVELWDEINAGRGLGWTHNPWCWAISFRVVQPTEST